MLALANDWADVDTMNKLADTYFKILLPLGAAIWALNRYITYRSDAIQLRVDSTVSKITSEHFLDGLALLVYRLDIVNTGNTLIEPFQQHLQIDAVSPEKDGLRFEWLYRWPKEGTHPGGPIEPRSWSAINDAIPIAHDVAAIRLFLSIKLSKQLTWTWHKTFDLTEEKGLGMKKPSVYEA